MAGGTSDHALPAAATATAAGAKRLFSNRRSKDFPELVPLNVGDCKVRANTFYGSRDDQYPEDITGSDSHLEKRNRNRDWPLKSNVTSNGALPEYRSAVRTRSKARDGATRQRSSSLSRPSKFVEGSMNDRTSQKPHLSYTGDLETSVPQGDGKQITSGNDWKKQRSHGIGHAAKNSLGPSAVGDESEVPRPSGIFRFGKSLAAAFHPSSWKIWSKAQEGAGRDKVHATVPGTVKDHRESNGVGDVRRLASKSQTHIPGRHASFSKHDSGIEFVNHNILEDLGKLGPSMGVESSAEKRYGRVFQEDPIASQWGYNEGRAPSDTPRPADASLRNRKLSLPNIRTVYNHRKLSDSADNLSRQPNGLRRLPSRKDLQKQQRLVKRVSDLEGRLEAARRQLAEALGEPIPDQASGLARSRFTPGGLASLPSESLLAAYATEDSDSGAVNATSKVGTAVSADERVGTHVVKEEQEENPELEKPIPQITITATRVEPKMEKSGESSDMQLIENRKQAQAAPDLQKATPALPKPRRNSPGKRKYNMGDDEEAYIPSAHSTNDDSSEAFASERKTARPRKWQRTGLDRKSSPKLPCGGQAGAGDGNARLGVDGDVEPVKRRQAVKTKKVYSSPTPSGRGTRGSSRDVEGHDSRGRTDGNEVPPVPKLPRDIFVAKDNAVSGGEKVVSVESARGYQELGREDWKIEEEADEEGKEGNAKNEDKDDGKENERGEKGEEKEQEKEPFEWPEDVF